MRLIQTTHDTMLSILVVVVVMMMTMMNTSEGTARLEFDASSSAAAYKFLHPCESAYKDLIQSLNDAQQSILNFLKVLFLYLTIYQQPYSFLCNTLFKAIYGIFDYFTNQIIQPILTRFQFQSPTTNYPWLSKIPYTMYTIIFVIFIFIFLFVSDLNFARNFRQSKIVKFFKLTVQFICFPPVLFISMDTTPIVYSLFDIIKATCSVLVKFIYLLFNLLFAFVLYLVPISVAYHPNVKIGIVCSLCLIPIGAAIISRRKKDSPSSQSQSSCHSFTEMSGNLNSPPEVNRQEDNHEAPSTMGHGERGSNENTSEGDNVNEAGQNRDAVAARETDHVDGNQQYAGCSPSSGAGGLMDDGVRHRTRSNQE